MSWSYADRFERSKMTICRSWIGATSALGSVVSSVKASPPAGIGRHRPAKQSRTDHRLKDADIVDHLVELVEKKAAAIEAAKREEEAAAALEPAQ